MNAHPTSQSDELSNIVQYWFTDALKAAGEYEADNRHGQGLAALNALIVRKQQLAKIEEQQYVIDHAEYWSEMTEYGVETASRERIAALKATLGTDNA